MRRLTSLLVGLLALASVAVASSGGATQAQPRWVITDLGTLGGRESSAVAINSQGQVVGSSETEAKDKDGDPVEHAFLWQDGKMRDLGAPGGRMNLSRAVAINDHGLVVGASGLNFKWRAVVWRGGRATDIGAIPDAFAPLRVNERGQVIGEGLNSNAFIWRDGRATDLGSLGGGGTWIEAINDKGQVVGESNVRGGSSSRAFLWQNGRMKRLAIPGSEAWALNERGEIVGWSYAGQGRQHATLWASGKMRDLGSLRQSSYAYAINQWGQVVGWSGVAPGLQHAFLWQRGKMIDLLPGRAFSRAYAINNQSEIAGQVGYRAVVWRAGKLVRLETLGGSESGVGPSDGSRSQDAINDHSQIVGWAKTKTGRIHAVLWTLKRG